MNIKNPRYTKSGTVEVEMEHPELGWVAFHATPDDPEEYGRTIYQKAVNGDYGPVEPYTPE